MKKYFALVLVALFAVQIAFAVGTDSPWWQRGATGNIAVYRYPDSDPTDVGNAGSSGSKNVSTNGTWNSNPNGTNVTTGLPRIESKDWYPRSNISNRTNVTYARRLNVTCIQGAVETRDSKIELLFGSYSQSITSALATRKSALKTAWALPETAQRRTATNNAWMAYKISTRTAGMTLRTGREAAWKSFRTDLRICGPGAEEPMGAGVDQLAN